MWYSKYLEAYGKTIDNVSPDIFDTVKKRIEALQSDEPVASVVLIGYNEERHLLAALWALSDMKCKYPIEIIGVDNVSKDKTAEVYERCGVPYFTETRKSCGWARSCGLINAKGKYHINIDADTMYPPLYVESMIDELEKSGVVAVSSLWSYMPDKEHPAWFLFIYEFFRDTHLWIQHFKRPELSVRGMVFAYDTQLAQKIGIRTDIIRGEDGSLALSLKNYGRISFLRSRKARAVTGYGTVSADGSMINALWVRIKKQFCGIGDYFTAKDKYDDEDANLVK